MSEWIFWVIFTSICIWKKCNLSAWKKKLKCMSVWNVGLETEEEVGKKCFLLFFFKECKNFWSLNPYFSARVAKIMLLIIINRNALDSIIKIIKYIIRYLSTFTFIILYIFSLMFDAIICLVLYNNYFFHL